MKTSDMETVLRTNLACAAVVLLISSSTDFTPWHIYTDAYKEKQASDI